MLNCANIRLTSIRPASMTAQVIASLTLTMMEFVMRMKSRGAQMRWPATSPMRPPKKTEHVTSVARYAGTHSHAIMLMQDSATQTCVHMTAEDVRIQKPAISMLQLNTMTVLVDTFQHKSSSTQQLCHPSGDGICRVAKI